MKTYKLFLMTTTLTTMLMLAGCQDDDTPDCYRVRGHVNYSYGLNDNIREYGLFVVDKNGKVVEANVKVDNHLYMDKTIYDVYQNSYYIYGPYQKDFNGTPKAGRFVDMVDADLFFEDVMVTDEDGKDMEMVVGRGNRTSHEPGTCHYYSFDIHKKVSPVK